MKQKCAVITGASRGIGAAAAERFAAGGWNLALSCVRSRETLEELARRLHAKWGITCLTYMGDMGREEVVREFFGRIEESFGGAGVLVNNAGISRVGLLEEMSLEEWEEVMRTNVTSAFLCARAAIPYMLRRKSGSIINVSSVWGCVGASCEAAYSASKGAVNALTRALAKELAPSGIAVNAVACRSGGYGYERLFFSGGASGDCRGDPCRTVCPSFGSGGSDLYPCGAPVLSDRTDHPAGRRVDLSTL